MGKGVEMNQLDPDAGSSRFQVARASVDFREPPSEGLSPDSHSNSNSQGRPSLANYETKYLRSLRHYLTRDALPRETHYRNLGSIAEGQLRPTIDQLRDENYIKDIGNVETQPESALKGKVIKFGWVEGVYMRCLLNIWGVMLFLRLTWVVGQAGLVFGLLIIVAANLITIITTISMSAVATNGQISGGGIYYMISRSLGPEFGASIGLLFTVSNSVAVAMYVIGFCSSFSDMLKEYADGAVIVDGGVNDARIIGSVAMVLILLLAIVGMEWVTRVQLLLLFLLIASQLDFVVGFFMGPQSDEEKAQGFSGMSWDLMKENSWSDYRDFEGQSYDFFGVFGVFFPAVTGIVAGANLSGDLKDPAEAIPKGTLLAIFTTLITYIVYPIMIAAGTHRFASGDVRELNVTDSTLDPSDNGTLYPVYNCTMRLGDGDSDCKYGTQLSNQVMALISAWAPLIYAGCFAATLSSAIASLVGAPRVLQALAKDKLYPYIHFFAKGYGANNDPFRGYIIVFLVAEGCVLVGQLNPIANLSSEVFLAAYALINLSCFHASLLKSPGWRPVFKFYNAWVSLIGAICCIVIMFLCDVIVGTIVLVLTLLLYIFVSYRKLDVNWGSTTQAQTYVAALGFMQRLNQVRDHVKNYRPQVLVLTGMPGSRPPLVDFANALTKNLSLLICGHVIKGPSSARTKTAIQNQANSWLSRHKVRAFYSLVVDSSFQHGAVALMQLAGLGNLKPNMTLMGFKNDWRKCDREEVHQYFLCIEEALDNYLAVAILRVKDGMDYSALIEDDALPPLHKSATSDSLKRNQSAGQFSQDGTGSEESAPNTPRMARPTVSDDPRSDGKDPRPDGDTGKKKKGQEAYLSTSGEPLPAHLVDGMTQFRCKQKKGFIDVWWLYDDGGLTLLLPYILTSRSQWSDCRLRVFALANKRDELDMEKRSMAALLSKFRIDYSDVIVIDDVTKKPQESTRATFDEMVASFHKEDADETPEEHCVSSSELLANKDKTNRHLRLHELVQEHSSQSSLVVMTLPMTRKGTVHAPLYMAWLEMVTKDMPPFLMIRGNQTSVLTFYS